MNNPTTNKPEFTATQIKNWRKFERVRKGGKYNMCTRQSTGLDKDEYLFVMRNFSALEIAAEKEVQ